MNLDDAIRVLAERDHILVATDFDGTVAQISEHPDSTVAHEKSMRALVSLAQLPGTQVAIVSGRPHRDLVRLVPESEILLIGEHGNDHGGAADTNPLIREITPRVIEIATNLEGSYVEHKNNSVSVHWRQATGDPSPTVETLKALAVDQPEISVLYGKKLIELSVATRTKADAVMELSDGQDDFLFLGDDLTDETVFEAMGAEGVSVKVGDGPTAARYRIGNVEEVADLLQTILSLRTS